MICSLNLAPNVDIVFAPDPIEAARTYGKWLYKTAGSTFMPELEVNYLCLCLSRGEPVLLPDGKPYRGRIRRHSFLLAPADFTKSTQAMHFLTNLCGARNYIGLPEDHDGPIFAQLSGDTTWESLRGGVQDGAPVYPVLHRLDYVVAEEAQAYLGSRVDTIEHQAHRMMEALESGNVIFSQKQAAAMSKKNKAAMSQFCREGGIAYDESTGSFHIKARFGAIFCSHFFEPKVERALHKSGFRGRFAECVADLTDDQLAEYYLDQFGDDDESIASTLRVFNRMAWRATFQTKNAPDNTTIRRVLKPLLTEYRSISRIVGKSLEDVYPKRTRPNVVQLLMAHAFAERLGRMGLIPEDRPVDIGRLEYTEQVVQKTLLWLLEDARRLRLRFEQTEDINPVLADSIKVFMDFVSKRHRTYEAERKATLEKLQKEVNEEPWRQEELDEWFTTPDDHRPFEFFTRKELEAHFVSKKVPSIDFRIAKLEKSGYIIRLDSLALDSLDIKRGATRSVHYQTAPFVMHELGCSTYDEMHPDDSWHPDEEESRIMAREEQEDGQPLVES